MSKLREVGQTQTGMRRTEKKHRQILEGARRLFFSKGYESTSTDEIAREAGVSKGTLYVHFPTKEKLFTDVAEIVNEELTAQIFDPDPNDHDVAAVLHRIALKMVEAVTDPGVVSAFRTMIGIADAIPEPGQNYYRNGARAAVRRLAAYFERQIEMGLLEIDDTELAAAQFLDMAQTTMGRPLLFGFGSPPSKERMNYVVTSAVNVFMKAYGRRPG